MKKWEIPTEHVASINERVEAEKEKLEKASLEIAKKYEENIDEAPDRIAMSLSADTEGLESVMDVVKDMAKLRYKYLKKIYKMILEYTETAKYIDITSLALALFELIETVKIDSLNLLSMASLREHIGDTKISGQTILALISLKEFTGSRGYESTISSVATLPNGDEVDFEEVYEKVRKELYPNADVDYEKVLNTTHRRIAEMIDESLEDVSGKDAIDFLMNNLVEGFHDFLNGLQDKE